MRCATAGRRTITLRMHKGDREVCLLVQDNGTGFNARPDGMVATVSATCTRARRAWARRSG